MWKNIKQIPGYMVSCTGKVLSLKNENPLILKQAHDGGGYLFVNLTDNGKMKLMRVHRLVASAFLKLDLHDKKICVLHKDDNPKNNNVVNLMVGTQKDNMLDMIKKGRNYKPKLKISESQVIDIRARLNNGEKGNKLAYEYKVSKSLISAIKNKKRWEKI